MRVATASSVVAHSMTYTGGETDAAQRLTRSLPCVQSLRLVNKLHVWHATGRALSACVSSPSACWTGAKKSPQSHRRHMHNKLTAPVTPPVHKARVFGRLRGQPRVLPTCVYVSQRSRRNDPTHPSAPGPSETGCFYRYFEHYNFPRSHCRINRKASTRTLPTASEKLFIPAVASSRCPAIFRVETRFSVTNRTMSDTLASYDALDKSRITRHGR